MGLKKVKKTGKKKLHIQENLDDEQGLDVEEDSLTEDKESSGKIKNKFVRDRNKRKEDNKDDRKSGDENDEDEGSKDGEGKKGKIDKKSKGASKQEATDGSQIEESEDEEKEEEIDVPNYLPEIVINNGLNYKTDVLVSIDELDYEWVRQAQLVSDYSDIATVLDDLKRKLERKIIVRRADLDPIIRNKLSKKQDKAPTVDQVKASIEKAASEFAETKAIDKVSYQLSMVNSALRSLEHKKKALENLTQLYLSGYFATPSEKRVTEKSRKITELFNDRMSKRQSEGLNKQEIQQIEESVEENIETKEE